ncbi:hypothetical protein Nepgr_006560 [Nepenthes gracilis]|uniref:Uncharacterized protein n=1 Tax=Nepenthes gracilis TaxID=150966 RepID=A0AAD3S5D7_NEPGR|nr:hypothetical protein Nepgr_006560 [Nepenthes gracilis]
MSSDTAKPWRPKDHHAISRRSGSASSRDETPLEAAKHLIAQITEAPIISSISSRTPKYSTPPSASSTRKTTQLQFNKEPLNLTSQAISAGINRERQSHQPSKADIPQYKFGALQHRPIKDISLNIRDFQAKRPPIPLPMQQANSGGKDGHITKLIATGYKQQEANRQLHHAHRPIVIKKLQQLHNPRDQHENGLGNSADGSCIKSGTRQALGRNANPPTKLKCSSWSASGQTATAPS